MVISLSTVSRCEIAFWLTLIDLNQMQIHFFLFLSGGEKLNLETAGKVSLPVTFVQQFVTKSKVSLIFIKTLLFLHKTTHFSNNSYDVYKNANGNSKFNITKLNPWKLSVILCCLKLSVILANKYKVKAKNFIISISFYGS